MMAGHLQTLAFLEMNGGEMLILMFIGLLVFGRRLPDVARNLGRSLNEFKKGMSDFQNSADEAASHVEKATNEAVAETDNQQTTQTTYDGTPTSYESQTTGEPAPQADANASAAEPASGAATDVSSTEQGPCQSPAAAPCAPDSPPRQAQPAENHPATSQNTNSTDAYQPMS